MAIQTKRGKTKFILDLLYISVLTQNLLNKTRNAKRSIVSQFCRR